MANGSNTMPPQFTDQAWSDSTDGQEASSGESYNSPPSLQSESSPKSQRSVPSRYRPPEHNYHVPELQTPTTPMEFKKLLLKTLPLDGVAGFVPRCYKSKADIPVMVYKNKTYYLRPNNHVLCHDPPDIGDEANTSYDQLHYDGQEPTTSTFKSDFTQPGKGSGDFFLPLGHLVEPARDVGGEIRVTNFIWALNISTKPPSLWLIFDYLTFTDVDDQVPDLSQIYWNTRNVSHQVPYMYERCTSPEGYLEIGEAWDVLKVFDDVGAEWLPDKPGAPKLDEVARRWELGPTMRAYATIQPPAESPGFCIGAGKQV